MVWLAHQVNQYIRTCTTLYTYTAFTSQWLLKVLTGVCYCAYTKCTSSIGKGERIGTKEFLGPSSSNQKTDAVQIWLLNTFLCRICLATLSNCQHLSFLYMCVHQICLQIKIVTIIHTDGISHVNKHDLITFYNDAQSVASLFLVDQASGAQWLLVWWVHFRWALQRLCQPGAQERRVETASTSSLQPQKHNKWRQMWWYIYRYCTCTVVECLRTIYLHFPATLYMYSVW